MSTISNKFFIQVLEDGSSLHGQLLATVTPTQSYKDGTFIPNWATNTAARPLIYLSLQNGSDNIAPDSDFVWSYNGSPIAFSATQTSETIGGTTYYGFASTNFNGVFFKTGTTSTNASPLSGMPALGIIGNVASSSNVDIDVIRFDGNVTLSTNPVPFSTFINITITQWTSGGFLGVLNFPNGNIITQAGQQLTCKATLFNDSGAVTNPASGTPVVEYQWYYEGSQTIQSTTDTLTILESTVTDYAVVRCDFYMTISGTRTLVASAFGSVDDQQDPEYMWIKYNGSNGNSASLRYGENVEFSICIGTQDDSTPITSWISFKVKILDSEGRLVEDETYGDSDFVYLAAADGEGYRPLTTENGVATAKVSYDDVVNLCKKGLTGYVVASTSQNNE